MLLRRITQHVKSQNWFAVVIDLVIVVVGVFIGIQVANWDQVRSDKAGLAASLERLDNEVSRNIVLIDEILDHYEETAADLSKGRAALNDCSSDPDAQAALERVLFDFTEDVQPNFVFVVANQLASQGRYQDLLSSDFQREFGFYAGRLKEEYEQLTSHYDRLWEHHINFHPDVSAFFPSDSNSYNGWRLELGRPLVEMCQDPSFRNRFINTIGFYVAIKRRLLEFKMEAVDFQTALNKERGLGKSASD